MVAARNVKRQARAAAGPAWAVEHAANGQLRAYDAYD